MTYNNFTLETVTHQFALNLLEDPFCESLPVANPQAAFLTVFEENLSMLRGARSQKAKSELIVSPILVEVRRLASNQVHLFSGEEFNVDSPMGTLCERERGLNGFCDFLLSKSTIASIVQAPIVMLVEADKEGLDLGWGQCVAQMVAAQIFNVKKGNTISTIYGSVTSGKLWQLLKLEGKDVTIDRHEYYVTPVERILGILKWMVAQQD